MNKEQRGEGSQKYMTAEPTVKKRRNPLLYLAGLVVLIVLFYATGLNRVVLGMLPPTEGQEGRIVVSSTVALLATDDGAFNSMVGAAQRNDQATINYLTGQGKVFIVPNGTRILILDMGAERTRVRVLSGEQTGKEGIVFTSFVER